MGKVIENGEKYLLDKGNPSSNVNSSRKLGAVDTKELPSAQGSSSKTSEVAIKDPKDKETGVVPFEGKEEKEKKNKTNKGIHNSFKKYCHALPKWKFLSLFSSYVERFLHKIQTSFRNSFIQKFPYRKII